MAKGKRKQPVEDAYEDEAEPPRTLVKRIKTAGAAASNATAKATTSNAANNAARQVSNQDVESPGFLPPVAESLGPGEELGEEIDDDDVPSGTRGQRRSATAIFDAFMAEANYTWDTVREDWKKTRAAEVESNALPRRNIYTILHNFVVFLYNHTSKRSKNSEGVLSMGTADNYLSQIKNRMIKDFSATSLKESARCTKIRSFLKSKFTDRAVKKQLFQQQAPAMTVQDVNILGSMLHKRGDKKSIHVSCTLTIMWHMLGRAIDSCWLTRQQLSIMPGGDLFVNFARLKTSSLQGVSLFPHKTDPLLCPFVALAVLLVTSEPSSLFIELVRDQGSSTHEMEDIGAISQLEASIEGIVDDLGETPEDDEYAPVDASAEAKAAGAKIKADRKRPSMAQLLNVQLKDLEREYKASVVNEELDSVGLTPGLQSHSERSNVSKAVCNALFASLLMHLPFLLNLGPTSDLARVVRDACDESRCSLEQLEAASDTIRQKFESDHPRHECKTCDIPMQFRELHAKLDAIQAGLSKVDALQASFESLTQLMQQHLSSGGSQSLAQPLAQALAESSPAAIAPLAATSMHWLDTYNKITPKIFIYKWFTEEPWKREIQGGPNQSKMSNLKTSLGIIKLVAQVPFRISAPVDRDVDRAAYNTWKSHVLAVAEKLEVALYANFKLLDGKDLASSASSLRTRFGNCVKGPAATTTKIKVMASATQRMLDDKTLCDEVTPVNYDGLPKLILKHAQKRTFHI
ncbi:hypothetical protein SPRG_20987 [Saprolegnia parasitica CBS 223.65]|uniref:Uncharacterized protein n=1 Tax=Saprolegnia parasitica (strain CBS 223.65) TaxID=695850 RepID=A0A067BXK7_SAPPC|nr:hypothetical protein SPRG_20987 [Saprolegnia parasitica CBS 223.65]KDO23239.1 hypothetical protein SPRG_20987 [Saprolegnia parasitica CBS 223.65]|eukprot:XP_012206073.1 hypothetical protein SPRG_20987 [Saprolegnia parasitica CBS 223.65]